MNTELAIWTTLIAALGCFLSAHSRPATWGRFLGYFFILYTVLLAITKGTVFTCLLG